MKTIKVILLCLFLISPQTAFADNVSSEELRDSEILLQKANELYKAGKYEEAVQNAEKAVAIKERAFGKNHPGIIRALNSLAIFYKAAGRQKDADNLNEKIRTMGKKGSSDSGLSQSPQPADERFEKATRLYKEGRILAACEMFEKSLEAEKSSQNPRLSYLFAELSWAGYCYLDLGQYDKALKYYEEALVVSRKLGKDDYVSISLYGIGRVYESWGQYERAIKYFEESLTIARKSGQKDKIANVLNGLGMVYNSWGQYDKAIKYFEEALTVARKSGLENTIAEFLHNIGLVYYEWGQYDKAIKYFEEALAIARKSGQEDKIAYVLNSIGRIYGLWGQYDKAIKYYEEALNIDIKLSKPDGMAMGLRHIGLVYHDWGRYDEAIKYLERALTISRKLNRENDVADVSNNIGHVYRTLGQYDEAIKYYEETLTISRKLGMENNISIALNNIGGVYYSLKDYGKAVTYFLESVTLKEKLRKTAKGDIRRDYLESQLDTYQYLISAYLRLSDFGNVFSTIELSRAKLLAEQISGSEDVPIPSIKEIQKAMSEKSAILIYANMNWEKDKIVLAITKEGIRGIELDSSLLNAFGGKHESEVNDVFSGIRGIKITGKEKEGALKEAKKVSIGFDEIINYYRSLLISPSGKGRGIEVKEAGVKGGRLGELSRMLHDFLIKPIMSELKGKTSLTILPDGVLGFLPFESLINGEGKYLVEAYEIKYAQSMAVMDIISKRNYTVKRKPLLAFGGAVYDRITYSADMVNSEKQLSSLGKKVYQKIASRSSTRDAYASLGVPQWSNLPGTLSEVKEIYGIVKGAIVYKGDEVTEDKIKELSSKGELSQYKVIHFATHGIVVPEMPELSAVVLSQFKTESGGDDGYLRMGEIAELKFNADFVNLSACETGLGKIYGGEGVVGLTQSFLIAGANGLSVSLWNVDDVSTSKFMTGLYELTEKRGMGYSKAITEMKLRFIRGDFGDSYKAPFYWAPFVYYGR